MGWTPATIPSSVSAGAPFVVAHRAGNQVNRLREAARDASVVIEADVRLHRGRLEIRHMKRAVPLPLLWDRWKIAPGWRRHTLLAELLAETPVANELVLDLKGIRPRVAELVRRAIEPEAGKRPIMVCARSWRLLEAFAGLPVRRFASVGSARQLQTLLRRFADSGACPSRFSDRPLDGVSIHERLLDRASVGALRRIAGTIMTWPVNTPERAVELLRLGVDGLISDDVPRILPALSGPAVAA